MAETIFVLTTDDVRVMAQQMGIDPNKLTGRHYHSIKKGVESGLERWSEVMKYAIQIAVQEEPMQQGNPGNPQQRRGTTHAKSPLEFVDLMLQEGASQYNHFRTPQDRKYFLYATFGTVRPELGIKVTRMVGSNQVLVDVNGQRVYDSEGDNLNLQQFRRLLLTIVNKLPIQYGVPR